MIFFCLEYRTNCLTNLTDGGKLSQVSPIFIKGAAMLYICRSCTNEDHCRVNMAMCMGGAGYSPKEKPTDSVSGYESLAGVLKSALDQAQHGKGKERHSNGKPFEQQPIMEIGRMVGVAYMTGQAMKKTQESMRLPSIEQKEKELLGAINYLAAAILLERENANHDAN